MNNNFRCNNNVLLDTLSILSFNLPIQKAILNQSAAIIDIINTGSSLNYNIRNIEIQSFGSRSLIGNITISSMPDKAPSIKSDFWISDNSTEKTEPLQTKEINLGKESPETIKKILSGAKTSTNSGLVQLSKTSLGWGIAIVKQTSNIVDASANI